MRGQGGDEERSNGGSVTDKFGHQELQSGLVIAFLYKKGRRQIMFVNCSRD